MIEDIQRNVAQILKKNTGLLTSSIRNTILSMTETQKSDVLHDPFHVMVGAKTRPTVGQTTTTKPDIVWEYESDPRIILSCGHAISKVHFFHIYISRNIE